MTTKIVVVTLNSLSKSQWGPRHCALSSLGMPYESVSQASVKSVNVILTIWNTIIIKTGDTLRKEEMDNMNNEVKKAKGEEKAT